MYILKPLSAWKPMLLGFILAVRYKCTGDIMDLPSGIDLSGFVYLVTDELTLDATIPIQCSRRRGHPFPIIIRTK